MPKKSIIAILLALFTPVPAYAQAKFPSQS